VTGGRPVVLAVWSTLAALGPNYRQYGNNVPEAGGRENSVLPTIRELRTRATFSGKAILAGRDLFLSGLKEGARPAFVCKPGMRTCRMG
jgi:hypothetical protein